jgi:hypothetical protein
MFLYSEGGLASGESAQSVHSVHFVLELLRERVANGLFRRQEEKRK